MLCSVVKIPQFLLCDGVKRYFISKTMASPIRFRECTLTIATRRALAGRRISASRQGCGMILFLFSLFLFQRRCCGCGDAGVHATGDVRKEGVIYPSSFFSSSSSSFCCSSSSTSSPSHVELVASEKFENERRSTGVHSPPPTPSPPPRW